MKTGFDDDVFVFVLQDDTFKLVSVDINWKTKDKLKSFVLKCSENTFPLTPAELKL